MIRKYLKMKAMEIQLKITFYSIIENVIKEKEDIFKLVDNLYNTFKDVPAVELQEEFITAIAEMIHESNKGE